MGHVVHHAIVITSWDEAKVVAARDEAVRLGCSTTLIVVSSVNGYHSFMVGPDGSKLGWAESDEGDTRRSAMIEWLRRRTQDSIEWCEVRYGADDQEAAVSRHAWQTSQERQQP